MAQFQAFMQPAEVQQAMGEDGVRPETRRISLKPQEVVQAFYDELSSRGPEAAAAYLADGYVSEQPGAPAPSNAVGPVAERDDRCPGARGTMTVYDDRQSSIRTPSWVP
jgi:hypothetical protein